MPDPKTQTYQVAEIAFAPDGLKGTENLLFNHAVWEIQGSETFLGRWHRARVAYDMTGYTGSVWIDGEPVLVGVPLQPDLNVQDRPEISLTRLASLPIVLWIDDVEVGFQDISLFGKDQKEVEPQRLFRDNFNGYESALFPLQGGWISGGDEAQQAEKLKAESTVEGAKASKAAETGERPANSEVDDQVYASSAKSFRLEGSYEEPVRAVKRFSIPERIPYSMSAEPFAIVAAGQSGQKTEAGVAFSGDGEEDSKRQKRWTDRTTGGTQRQVDRKDPGSSRPAPGTVRRESAARGKGTKTMSGVPVTGTFYVYAFDGRLLAEYNVLGQLVREYIYFGGMLVAEYRNQESRLLYYTSDQINSTRIVTDNTGTVVYAAAHEPYGGIQKTWVSSYDPSLKFSGKERDAESDLDYFGARYYDRSLYRFLSVDPIISGRAALSNPQRWNQYAYCLSNPVNYVDQGGASPIKIEIIRKVWDMNSGTCYGEIWVNGVKWGDTLENLRRRLVPNGSYKDTLTYELDYFYGTWDPYIKFDFKMGQWGWNELLNRISVTDYIPAIMAGDDVGDLHGCIYVSLDVMKALERTICFYQEEASRYYQNLMISQQKSLEGSGIDIVLSSLDAIDYLSMMCWSLQDLQDANDRCVDIRVRNDI